MFLEEEKKALVINKRVGFRMPSNFSSATLITKEKRTIFLKNKIIKMEGTLL